SNGIVVETRDDSPYRNVFSFGRDFHAQGFELLLRRARSALAVHFFPSEGLKPVWTAPEGREQDESSELPTFVFGCVGSSVREAGLLDGAFTGTVAGEQVFRIQKLEDGSYRVSALAADLEIHTPERTLILERRAELEAISAQDLARTRICYGACDWHFASAGKLWGAKHAPIQTSYPRGGPG
ncbi:MAG TPA: hypothetical protein VM598_09755, partial [Bdellovibrionota bacterium]|nr:hypothetical protein [Bdellovibrionota bacterium]